MKRIDQLKEQAIVAAYQVTQAPAVVLAKVFGVSNRTVGNILSRHGVRLPMGRPRKRRRELDSHHSRDEVEANWRQRAGTEAPSPNSRLMRQAFSLVEAVVALAVLALLLAMIGRGVMGGRLAAQKARNMRTATDVIEAKFDEMRNVPLASLNNQTFPSPFDVVDPEQPSRVIGEGTIVFSDRTEEGVDGALRVAEVTVEIAYTRSRVSVSAATFFAPE